MHKKHQISVKDLKKQVNSALQKKEFDFFDLRIQEQNKTNRQRLIDKGSDLFMDTLGPEIGKDIGDGLDTAKKAQKAAVDATADAMWNTFGPAPVGLIDFVDSINTFLGQAAGVWAGITKQFSENRRRLDRKLFFEGSHSKQAIVRVEPKNPSDFPLLNTVKQHFLIFPEFCSDEPMNLDFTIKNYSGIAPTFTDPGTYCLSKRVDAVLEYWESTSSETGASFRNELINFSTGKNAKDDAVLTAIDKKVEQFIELFDQYVKLKYSKAEQIGANLPIEDFPCTFTKEKAKKIIRSIYLNNVDFYHASNLMSRGRQLRGKHPCIIDCFPLLLMPVYFSIFPDVERAGSDSEKSRIEKLAKEVVNKGHANFLKTTYRLKWVPNYIKTNQDFKKAWFAFAYNRFYNPFNEDPENKGFDHWVKTSDVFTKGSWDGKNGIDMISNVFYSAAEIGLLTAGTSSVSSGLLKIIGKPEAAKMMRSPQAFLIISLSLSVVMLLAFAFDPFKTFTKIEDLKKQIKEIITAYKELIDAYSADSNSNGDISIDTEKIENIKDKIANAGSSIQTIIIQISQSSAQYGMESEDVNLEHKKQMHQQLDSIVKWLYSNTRKNKLTWIQPNITKQYAPFYLELAKKATTAMEKLLVEIEGSEKATGDSLKIILPNFKNIGGDIPGSAIKGIEASSRTGTVVDFVDTSPSKERPEIKRENKISELVFRKDRQTFNEDFPIENADAKIKELHKELQMFFPNTYYFSDSTRFRTAVVNLRDLTFKKTLTDLLDQKLRGIKKINFEKSSKPWHKSSFFGWFDDWANESIFGRWPTVPEIKRSENKGIKTTVSALKDDRYRTSGLGLMSSPGFAASTEVMTIMIGPSASLYNTSLFVGNPSSTSGRAMAISKVNLSSNDRSPTGISVEPISSKYAIIAPPKLAFLENIAAIESKMKTAYSYNQVLIAEIKKIQGQTDSSREEIPVLKKGAKPAKKQISLVEKYKNFIEICNTYYLIVKKIQETFKSAIDLNEWQSSISNFKSKAEKLNRLSPQAYGSGTHTKLIEDLRRESVKIMNLYYNYDTIVNAMENSSVNSQINFRLLFKYILKDPEAKQ